MVANEMARRAERIAGGNGVIDDVEQLLLHLREGLADGHIVRDMGDFIAHRAARTQGPAKEITSNMIGALLFMARADLERTGRGKLTYDQLKEGLNAQCFLISRKLSEPQKGTFIGRAKRFINSIVPLPGNDWVFPQHQSKKVKATESQLCRVEPRCAFTIAEYATEFLGVLIAQGYLQAGHALQSATLERLLSLHAMIRLHGSTLANPYGGPITLRASFGSPASILATCEVDEFGSVPVGFGLPLLQTNLEPAEVCHAPLDTWGTAEWNEPLELIDGKIGVLGYSPGDPAVLELAKGRPLFEVKTLR